ncbi:hypothetical protein AOY38_10455 [Synechocystis sp. PCC 6803]|nr:hypothetical protein AOY38_10455 [Synechocystis sp. PCC 6803]
MGVGGEVGNLTLLAATSIVTVQVAPLLIAFLWASCTAALTSIILLLTWFLACIPAKLGKAMAAKIPTITVTTPISISVHP